MFFVWFQFQFGFNMFPEIPRPFNMTYQCFSVAMLNDRQDVERGGKSKSKTKFYSVRLIYFFFSYYAPVCVGPVDPSEYQLSYVV